MPPLLPKANRQTYNPFVVDDSTLGAWMRTATVLHIRVRLARRGRNAQHPYLHCSHCSAVIAHWNRSVPEKAIGLKPSALHHSPAKFTQLSQCGPGALPRSSQHLQHRAPPPSPSRNSDKSPLRKCNLQHLRENPATTHRVSCKWTGFSIAIHMVSTIIHVRNIMQSALCAILCETQSQKRAHIRRIFSVAKLVASA
jgi:hypothetical protein